MEHKVTEYEGEKFKTVSLTATDFDKGSDMENVVVGVYSNGRGFVSCRPKKGFPFSIPLPFMEQGKWQYVEEPDGLGETE